MAEIVRAGIQSVDPGQTEAASALGMSRGKTLRRIVLPQAMRVIVPPTGNETIAMLKDTSLLIAVPVTSELNFQLRAIGSRTFQIIPMAVASILWYLALSSLLMVGQYFLEKRFSRGFGARETRSPAGANARRGRWGHALSTARARRPAAAAPMVKAEAVHKSFGALEVLKGIDLEVAAAARSCACIGPSGSGKSTFLRCINHLEKINAGRLSVDGDLVGYREKGGKLLRAAGAARSPPQRRDIGMVFQRFNLFPHMTALENVIEAPVAGARA